MKTVRLCGALIRTQILLLRADAQAVELTPDARPWDEQWWARHAISISGADKIDVLPENQDYARLCSHWISVPAAPEWSCAHCVAQWQRWRRSYWLREWVQATSDTARRIAQLVCEAYDSLTKNRLC
jgi:hypothetical protein